MNKTEAKKNPTENEAQCAHLVVKYEPEVAEDPLDGSEHVTYERWLCRDCGAWFVPGTWLDDRDKEIAALCLFVEGKDGLLAAYRIGRPPSEKTWKKLERAKQMLEDLDPGDQL